MATEGWIKLHRKLLEWGWADDPNMLALWCRILLTATHEAKSWRGIHLKPGQVVFGRDEWARKTGISPRSLRTCLERLKSTNELTIETTNRYSILTVVNWKEYQAAGEPATSKTASQPTNERPATDQQPTTSKECKNERMKEEDIEGQAPHPLPDSEIEKPKASKKASKPPLADDGLPEFFEWSECYEYFTDAWNDMASVKGLPQVAMLNDKRKKAIRELYANECGVHARNFKQAVRNLAADSFNLGFNDREWKASFDYILRPDKFLTYLERKA